MVEIKEVKTKKQQREFMNFPLELYRDNPYFVPPLWLDEINIFKKNYAYYKTCEAVYYNAYRGGEMVGRISGILQKASNELRGEKRVRFSRFDSIDDFEVAEKLFSAVEKWAVEKGMNAVCGPLGFSDLEREGLLIEGFDKLSTFEEQYNYEYYARLIEHCGYSKEVDWIERQIRLPDDGGEKLMRVAESVKERYNLKRSPENLNARQFVGKYGDGFFSLLDKSYAHLYGTVPFSEAMKKMTVRNFKLIIDMRFAGAVLNENGEVIGLGAGFPSMARALQKSRGHLTPAAIVRILKSVKKPKILELGLIGVDPEYRNQGAAIIILANLAKILKDNPSIEFAETNLCLETNTDISNLWEKRFNSTEHKRRRAYIKNL